MSRLLKISAVSLLAAFVACSSDEADLPDLGTPDTGQEVDSQQTEECGNGVLDGDEDCDTAITEGAGACPTSCDDSDACTTDELLGSACNARCRAVPITACSGTASDGCCPDSCDAASDVDCGSCGNGELDAGERCDTAITAGEPGACPADCDDGNSCTLDTLSGAGCSVRCQYSVQTLCSMTSDGCCPSGCTSDTDADCSATCGNGLVDDGETCDTEIALDLTGACPVGCDDGIACTTDELVGSGCNISCSNREIDSCNASTSDGCCPLGCTTATDVDCKAECGNGVVDDGETCDIKIDPADVGGCPVDCDDGIACTADQLVGRGSCTASCSHASISKCSLLASDGCCPLGCTSLTDSDCKAECGNGVLDKGETCDTKIPAGEEGACPQLCDDGIVCTSDKLVGGGTCTASCSYSKITQCVVGASDGCCPQGCTTATDSDCKAECGNGVVDTDETCDTKIAVGQTGACPTSCDDKDSCTNDTLVGGGTCNAACSFTQITQCSIKLKDGCCPKNCNANTDADCTPVCGNAVVESGENCDIKIPAGDEGACPEKCDDGQACTDDSLEGTECDAICVFKDITKCVVSLKDGCCPPTCNANTDADCSADCGNGVLETGELCDPGITDPAANGYCPKDVSECDDKDPCTEDKLDENKCQTQCVNAIVTTCGLKDACCPNGCNANNDGDCDPVCGNGVVESGEACDTGIKDPATIGYCPTSCDDNNTCTEDTLKGLACEAQCFHRAATCGDIDKCCLPDCKDLDCENCKTRPCGVIDGCCPDNCTIKEDGDCSLIDCSRAICGMKDGCCPLFCSYLQDADCPPIKG